MLGEFLTEDALKSAEEEGLALVRVGGTDELPTCKIMDKGRYLYEKKKRARQSKPPAHNKIKEIRFRVTTGKNDLKIAANKADKFLNTGCRIKVTVSARGRENAHKHLLAERFEEFYNLIQSEADYELSPKVQGRSLISILTSKK